MNTQATIFSSSRDRSLSGSSWERLFSERRIPSQCLILPTSGLPFESLSSNCWPSAFALLARHRVFELWLLECCKPRPLRHFCGWYRELNSNKDCLSQLLPNNLDGTCWWMHNLKFRVSITLFFTCLPLLASLSFWNSLRQKLFSV